MYLLLIEQKERYTVEADVRVYLYQTSDHIAVVSLGDRLDFDHRLSGDPDNLKGRLSRLLPVTLRRPSSTILPRGVFHCIKTSSRRL